jgi:ABC-type multidrug transport system fused ATPase/permease subunit
MLKAVKASLAFMTSKERSKWYLLNVIRSMLSVLDLAGVLAIGFVLTSAAVFLTQGSSPDRVLEFAGVQLPAVTAQTLPFAGAMILATLLLKAFLSILITKKIAFFVATIEARSAKVIAEKVFNGDLAQARLKSREETTFAIQVGSPAAFNSLLNAAAIVFAEAALFVMICLGFLIIDPIATFAAVAYFAAIAILIQYFIGTLMARAGALAVEGNVNANAAVGDLISVFRELSVLGRRGTYIDRIYKSRVETAQSEATKTYLSGMPRYVVESALLVGVAAFVLVQALTGDIVASAATLGVFLSGGFRLTAAILPLQSALLNISGTLPAAKRAHEILFDHTAPSLKKVDYVSNTGPRTAETRISPLGVKFEDVSFHYSAPNAPAILNVSLTIEPGQQVAFIGASGAGKSTIADLMCAVLTPSSGTITVMNWEAGSNHNAKISISYVPQKPGLVSGTVATNVALGIEPAELDEARVWQALENANLGPVIRSLPEGIYTELGNHQDGLSGGQIQRLGMARALYSKPGLLIMDEATSALDAESEAEIAKALNQMRGKVTVVLIAHRLNTVQHADRVFLIDQGRVQDEGTFKELLARNPSIERLVQLMKVDEG